MKPELTQTDLINLAASFCHEAHEYSELYGVTDGKAVGTFVEHQIRDRIKASFVALAGNSA